MDTRSQFIERRLNQLAKELAEISMVLNAVHVPNTFIENPAAPEEEQKKRPLSQLERLKIFVDRGIQLARENVELKAKMATATGLVNVEGKLIVHEEKASES